MVAEKPTWRTDRAVRKLIRSRASRMGVAAHDVEDVTQEILVQLSAFEFDARKTRGARETTVLVAIIDRRVRMWQRSHRRRRERLDRLQATADQPVSPPTQEKVGMLMDVGEVVAGLQTDDRRLCHALGEGRTVAQIAAEFGWSWHTVRRRIDLLREHFRQKNLDAWLN